MAEALISVLIENLGSLAFNQIGEEVKLVKDVKVNVLELKGNLETIQVVLEDAERKQLSDVPVRLWLEKLKSVSHEMDQLLDEWNTRAMIGFQDHAHTETNKDKMLKELFFSQMEQWEK